MTKNIAVIVGSLRKDSFNKKMANALMYLAPASLSLKIIEIGRLPIYDQDLDENPPAEWVVFRETLKSSDGFLFVSPEYNRSYSAVIKNAIEVGSRPPAENAWRGKPGGVITVSPGSLGGFGANNHLRQVLAAVSIPVLPQPETYISQAGDLFDAEGRIAKADMKERMESYLSAFAQWVEKF